MQASRLWSIPADKNNDTDPHEPACTCTYWVGKSLYSGRTKLFITDAQNGIWRLKPRLQRQDRYYQNHYHNHHHNSTLFLTCLLASPSLSPGSIWFFSFGYRSVWPCATIAKFTSPITMIYSSVFYYLFIFSFLVFVSPLTPPNHFPPTYTKSNFRIHSRTQAMCPHTQAPPFPPQNNLKKTSQHELHTTLYPKTVIPGEEEKKSMLQVFCYVVACEYLSTVW